MGVHFALLWAVLVVLAPSPGRPAAEAVPCRLMTEELRRRDLSLFERWASAKHTLTKEEYDRRRARLMQRLERSGEACRGAEQHEVRTLGEEPASQQTDSPEPADPWRCVPDPTHRRASVDGHRWEKMCSADFAQLEPWVQQDPFVMEPEDGNRGVRDVAAKFAGQTLAIIGDSISRQWADSIQCEAEREGGLAAATPIPLDSELRASGCDVAFSVVRAGGDGASETALLLPRRHRAASSSRSPSLPVAAAQWAFCKVRARELHLPVWPTAAELSWDFVSCIAGCGGVSSAQVERMQLVYCKQDLYTPALVQPLLDKADGVVLNFGLHYHDMAVYRQNMTELARHLTRWLEEGEGRRRHVMFRETSAQHFAGVDGTGDYDARDAFRAENNVEGCGCTAIRAKDKVVNPNDRNAIVLDVLTDFPRITIVPFFNLTRPRYNMHFESEMSLRDRLRACDCTHFCYSPPFWQRLNHDWYSAVVSSHETLPSAE